LSRGTTTLWFGALSCLGLAAWLFLPRVSAAGSTPRLRVALVDASASVARDRTWLPWVRSELRALAQESRAADEELAVASFADGLGRLRSRRSGRFAAELEAGAVRRSISRPGSSRDAPPLEGVEPWRPSASAPGEARALAIRVPTPWEPAAVPRRARGRRETTRAAPRPGGE
jgi:hypothetical protein